jgi:hypothetical protein
MYLTLYHLLERYFRRTRPYNHSTEETPFLSLPPEVIHMILSWCQPRESCSLRAAGRPFHTVLPVPFMVRTTAAWIRNENGLPALWAWAGRHGHLDILRGLVARGAEDREGTAIAYDAAVRSGNISALRFLLGELGVSQVGRRGLLLAASLDMTEVMEFLVESGADLAANGQAALAHATGDGALNSTIWLRDKGIKLEGGCLRLAAIEGHIAVVKYLLECGVTDRGEDARALAAMWGHRDVVEILDLA